MADPIEIEDVPNGFRVTGPLAPLFHEYMRRVARRLDIQLDEDGGCIRFDNSEIANRVCRM